jgi:hypothetical protein
MNEPGDADTSRTGGPALDSVEASNPSFSPSAGRPLLILILIYVAVVLLHVWALDGASRFPHIPSDEVQFAMTGENIRLGKGFTLRGEFNTSSPPLFPLFVAAAYSLGGDQPRESMLIASSLAMCLVVFIAFNLARLLGIRRDSSYVLAGAAAMAPHTFYAGTHMTEILQFPLFLGSFYVGLQWIERPTLRRDILLGILLAAAASVKIQTIHLLLALLTAVIVVAAHAWRYSRQEAASILKHALAVFGIVSVAVYFWLLFKQAHGGDALGIYRGAIAGGLRHWSPLLMLAYLADFLLAAGLVTAAPLLWWFRDSKNFRMSVFCGAVLVIQYGAVSIIEGGLGGWMRERQFMYSLPIMAILAVAGLQSTRRPLKALRAALVFAIPLALTPLLALYSFPISPVIETPWANALGAFNGVTIGAFSRAQLLVVTAVLICLVSGLLSRLRSAAPLCLSVFVLIFYSFGFGSAALGMARWSENWSRLYSPVLDWLHKNGVAAGDRLLISARPSYFQFQARRWSPDEFYLEWNRTARLNDPFFWRLELLGRFDVRTLPDPRFLPDISLAGDAVLTAAHFDGLEALDARFPLNLYRVPRNLAGPPQVSYEMDIPARVFRTQAGEKTPSQLIVGDGSGDKGFLVYGPYLPAPRGTYELTFEVTGDAEMPITVDVYEHPGNKTLSVDTTIESLDTLTFPARGTTTLEYRIFGEDDLDFRFSGVKLRYLSETPASQ